MIIRNRLFLVLCTFGVLPENHIRADSSDALLYAAGTLCLGAAGYGLYKLYESNAFNSAQQKVSEAQDTVQKITAKNYCPVSTPDELFRSYSSHLNEYEAFRQHVKRDLETLERLDGQLKTLRNRWTSTAYAQDMVREVKSVLQDIGNIVGCLVKQTLILDTFKPIIALENMLKNEQYTPYLQLTDGHNNLNAIIMTTYATSQWPYLQAFWDLSARKQTYQDYVRQAHVWNNEFPQTLTTAGRIIAAYEQVESTIILNPRFTEDRRYKQQYDNEQERLRLEREKTDAARRQAEAAERQAQAARQQANAMQQQAHASQRQADALTQQNIQQLKNRLLEIRLALNNTKAHIEQADHFDYPRIEQLKRTYNLLRTEAISIRNQLYGHPDIIQLFVDIFTASEYV